MNRFWIPIAAWLVAFATLQGQTLCTAVGKERWPVKTMAPSQATTPVPITLSQLASLAAPGTATSGKPGAKTDETRYSDKVDGFHEGELVNVTGWVRFIKLSSDDCDYHIQITPDPDKDDGMVVVEIPDGDAAHVADVNLRSQVDAARDGIPAELHLKRAPGAGGSVIGKAFMTFEGALYFDAPHYPNCGSRGVGMHAATCWEIHPVTAVRFAVKP